MQPIQKTQIRSAVLGAILAVVIIQFGRTTLGKFCIVDGKSMWPTLNPGDVVQAKAYYVKARGDVVILTDDSGCEAVKRIVGLPGEAVTIYGGEVYVNGRRLFEPYLEERACTFKNNQKNESPGVWHLADDQYFVMGDNRYGSCDSRHYGPVRQSAIHGIVNLPTNALAPVFLDITYSGPGCSIPDKPDRETLRQNQTLEARQTSSGNLRSLSQATIH